MEFINFLLTTDLQFWISLGLFIGCMYIYTVIKDMITDVIDVRCTYGRYCKHLKLLYKPTKLYFIDGIKKEFPWVVVFSVLYILFYYFKVT